SGYDGLQYYGKGGTDLLPPTCISKMQNYDKQLKLMKEGRVGNPNVLGMMYWTITGLIGNIKQRNKILWQGPQRRAMAKLWLNGLGTYVKRRTPNCADPDFYFKNQEILKRFMPNIVMIDFANLDKCETIFHLNKWTNYDLMNLKDLMRELKRFD